ncbi:energy transducer TonB [Flavicella sediminum]|uniref:energy transducer TonB n=1 Tax=Flavicella sediminum TaxID=2585141 RepID=UPI00111CD56E|nr:energy transducer TonB [Flavicella sediminum]
MKYLETKHQKKSAVMTTVLMLALLFLIYAFGMKYQDPPEEYGVAINFGTSDVGNGPPVIEESVKSAPKVQEVQEQVVEEVAEEAPEVLKEELITQENVDAPVVAKEKKKEIQKPKPRAKEIEKKPIVKEVPKPSKETQNALANLLNGSKSDGATSKGEGDDQQSGLKGKVDGDPTSSKYYGNGGTGGDGNYNLAGRKPLTRPVVKPNCNEEGTVVVSIEVDKTGKVIKATPGVKGTTNTAPCLLSPAKQAALQTKWNADGDAPNKQVGVIVYKFSLSE